LCNYSLNCAECIDNFKPKKEKELREDLVFRTREGDIIQFKDGENSKKHFRIIENNESPIPACIEIYTKSKILAVELRFNIHNFLWEKTEQEPISLAPYQLVKIL